MTMYFRFLAVVAFVAAKLRPGAYEGRRRRPEGQPFGLYPGTAPLRPFA